MPCSSAGAQGFHRQSMCLSWCRQLCNRAMSSKPAAGALLKPSHPASVPLGFGTPNGSTSWVTVTKSCEGEKPRKVSCNLLAAFPSQAVNEQLGDRRLGFTPWAHWDSHVLQAEKWEQAFHGGTKQTAHSTCLGRQYQRQERGAEH